MSIYFNEHGSAIGYQVDGRWTIKGDYLQVEHGANIPGGLYKIDDNKVKFPFDYKEVEGEIDTEKLTSCKFAAGTLDFGTADAMHDVVINPLYDDTEACVVKITRAVS